MKAPAKGLCLAAWLVATAGFPAQTQTSAKLDVRNFKRVSDDIAVGGQPSEAALPKIKEAGFRTVLNLRGPNEATALEEEREKLESLGLHYVNIPITAKTITQDKVKRFVEVVSQSSNKPLFVHCASGNRVGGMWFLYRRLVGHLPEDRALREAREVGLKSPALEAKVIEFARSCPSLQTPCN